MVTVVLAGMLSMALALLLTPAFASYLVRQRYGQVIRDDLAHHQEKRGKPNMGGVVIIGATLAGYLGAHAITSVLARSGLERLSSSPMTLSGLLVLLLLVGIGIVGFLDDYTKVRKERSLGLTSGQKLLGQTVVTLLFVLPALFIKDERGRTAASTAISHVRDSALDLGVAGPVIATLLFFVWAYLLIAGASNGVNITDGLDGLAVGSSFMAFAAYTVIGVWQASQDCARAPAPACYEVRDPLDLAAVACAIAGACAGFLWWNASPARIIMGDTGSLSLGAALAGLAMLSRTELLLALLGGLFVIITLSVIIQVISFKTRGKRVFRMSPLHHHFELVGWAEITIVLRFWIIAGICVLTGLALFYGEWASLSR